MEENKICSCWTIRLEGWTDGQPDWRGACISRPEGWMHGQPDLRDGWADNQTEEWMHGQPDQRDRCMA